MNRKGVAVVLVLMFAMAVGAGAVAGKLTSRVPTAPPPVVRKSTLADELKLSPEQNSKMQEIWQPIGESSSRWVADAKTIQQEEDRELTEKILTEDQREQFRLLREKSKKKLEDLGKARRARFHRAVEETKQILNAEQREIYDKIIKERLPDATGGSSEGWNFPDTAQVARQN